MILRSETERRFVTSLGLLSLLCLGLLAFRIVSTGKFQYLFIPGNLALAWASLIFAWLLGHQLKKYRWKSWQNIILTVLWLIFLPNSWYVLTDLIHVYPSGQISQLYDIALVGSLVLSGFFLGFTSLYLVHRELIKRLSDRQAAMIVGGVILLSSFAIYLGRILRWNSWDIIKNPGGLILNISDRIVDPFAHVSSFTVTALFFVTLSVMYLSFWVFVQPRR
ncbi:MAG: hypothetical protein JWO96_633 [Candidatus Saccharibacteria bacterium]|nr:hypothetical protein [Candidatus Saccharibacteria bacterium]